jgi:hypothetical protein
MQTAFPLPRWIPPEPYEPPHGCLLRLAECNGLPGTSALRSIRGLAVGRIALSRVTMVSGTRTIPLTSGIQTLMQPDNPTASCCGESDAYWCDKINVRAGKPGDFSDDANAHP